MTSQNPSPNKEYPIREIFQDFLSESLKRYPISVVQLKAANNIINCKTGGKGYSVSFCEVCGIHETHACSCNDRNCPSCQVPQEKKWVLARNSELIEGIAYYHLIFTMPHELNDLIYTNQELLYGLLFKCASDTILTLCADREHMGATPGIISVLHTWGQQMNYHPHLHLIISGGGLTATGQFRETKRKGFFIPIGKVAKMFRGKYMATLKSLWNTNSLKFPLSMQKLENESSWKNFINELYSMKWLPFVKETFNGNGNAIKYLGRYAFRTTISNHRIQSFEDGKVTFSYKDYKDGNKQKAKTVSCTEFIRLFLMHVLPKGFHRVRFSGFLTNSLKTKNLIQIHQLRETIYLGNPVKNLNTEELMVLLYNRNISDCSACNGRLIMIRLPRGEPLTSYKLNDGIKKSA